VTVSVVIADDTPDIRRLLRALFEQERDILVVGEAADGQQAVEVVRSTHPDAVLLDLAMPRMDGLEALPGILEASPASKVVVLSGFAASAMAQQALSRGAHAYLPKGTSGAAIAAKLREVCGVETPPRPAPEPAPEPRTNVARATATAVHELRNQVLVVEGFTKALRESWDALSEERRRDFFDRVLRNVGQMRELIGAIGDLAQIEARNLTLHLRRIELGQLVRDTVEDLAVDDARQITVRAEGEVLVLADPARVRQVIASLLSSAERYSPEERPITVTVGVADGSGEILVADDGFGIPADRIPELFQPFTRFDAEQPGSGLGLYVSREIMLAHGGTLELIDAERGARFAVRLPLLADQPEV
jgi:signal transduction histidine kinase